MSPSLSRSALLVVLCGVAGTAHADDLAPALELTLKDHRFTPTEIHVAAGRQSVLQITNGDATPEEFEMRQLAIEKVMQGGGHAKVRLPPLEAGRYAFVGEYNEATAQGTIIADPPGDLPKQ